jgi:uncharacterized protein (TIGR02466 family)
MDAFRLFYTPILVFSPEETALPTDALRDRLVAESRSGAGVSRSNAGAAWHSVPDLALRPEACFQAVIRRVVEHAQRLTGRLLAEHGNAPPPNGFAASAHAWAVVTGNGGYGTVHDHSEAHWSSAFYVDAGDADPHSDSGTLVLVDPRRATSSVSGVELIPSNFAIRPRTGMLVLFPGWLQHFAHPYAGTRPRVVVSVNVRLQVSA